MRDVAPLDPKRVAILNALMSGPVKVGEIAEYAHTSDGDWHGTEPKTREFIRKLRLEGHPICSGPKGYWIGSAQDVEQCADELLKRASAIREVGSALKLTAHKMRKKDARRQGDLWGQ